MIRRIIRGLGPYLSDARRQAALLLVTSVVGGAAEAMALLLTVRVALSMNGTGIDAIELPVVDQTLRPEYAVLIATGCAIAALLAHVAIASQSARLGSSVLAAARAAAVRRFIEAGWPTQEAQREGALQETVTSLASRVGGLSLSLTGGASQLVTLFTFLLAALIADVATTLTVLVLGGLIVFCLRPLTKVNRERSRAFVDAGSHYAEEVARMTSTAMELRVFGVQRAALADLDALNGEVRRKHYQARFIATTAGGILRDLAVLLLAVCIGALVFMGRDSIEGLGVAMALVIRSLASAQAVNGAWHSIAEGIPNLELFNSRLDDLAAGTLHFGSSNVDRIESIEFDQVSYHYADDVQALSDMSFRLVSGETLGVVGPSGGGKSTLVQVLLRLRPPTNGRVMINGEDYLEIDETNWAAMLAFVPQEPILLEGSVYDNIRYYRDLPDADVIASAREANVFDDIVRLPMGFDTKLGPRGTGLSGGQKQRVAIARALAGKPQLLVLDEPSSALDTRSEQLLRLTLDRLKGRTTTVIVAHRMATVDGCDRILVIERGRIAQLGAPDELRKVDGFYRVATEGVSSSQP